MYTRADGRPAVDGDETARDTAPTVASPTRSLDGSARPFCRQQAVDRCGDVVAVATAGHTADHLSVLVEDKGTTFFLVGDTSYDERLMLAGRIDGVIANDDVASATLGAIRHLGRVRPMVYLPTHDPESASRLGTPKRGR
jgi:N-acyl homoserine lactone hydrolase